MSKNRVNTLLPLIIWQGFNFFFSAASGGISIIPFTIVIGVPAGIANASFSLLFSLTTEIIKKLLSITKNKKRNMIRFLC